MGVSAGRVLLIPKGDWNAEATYTGLDWVRHNGAAWVCKNTCTNVEPTEENSDNWQIMSRDGIQITVDAEISDQSENPVQNKVIKAYVDEHTPEVADMTGATATQNGAHGLVPAPQIGDEKKALLGDGTWGSVDAILTFKTKEEYDVAVANDEIPDGAKVIKEYDEGDSTAIIDVDTVMSDTSENPVQNKAIKKYVDEHTPEVADMTGATAEANGTSGTVPAPKAGQESHILNGDGTWASPLDNAIISAKIEELNQAIEDAKALKASLETYGMVQLNDTSVVTDSTGLALPSTEKNPNLEGTLAYQISQLNTDLMNNNKWELIGKVTGANSVGIDNSKYNEFYVRVTDKDRFDVNDATHIIISNILSGNDTVYSNVSGKNTISLISIKQYEITNYVYQVGSNDEIQYSTMTVYGRR